MTRHQTPVQERRQHEDEALFRRFSETRSPAVREQIIERFMPLARSLASRYRRHAEPFEDLLQVANLGLIKAVDGFDPARASRLPPMRCQRSLVRFAGTFVTTSGLCGCREASRSSS